MLITALPDIMIPVEDILSLELFMLTFSFSQQARKAPSYASSKLRLTDRVTDGGEV